MSFFTNASSKASSRCELTVGCSFDFTNASLEKPVGLNGRMVSALTHDSHRVCGQCMAPERSNLKVRGTRPARSAGNFFLVVPLHFFGLKVQLVVLVSAFVMVSTVWPVSCLLFFCSQCPHTLRSRHHCCSYALRGSYKSIIVTHAIDTAVRLWAPTHIRPLFQLPIPLPIF